MSPKQGIVSGNVKALDSTMRTSVAGGAGLVFYALIACLVFVGLVFIWPLWGPTATMAWFLIWILAGVGVLIYTRWLRA